MEFFYSSPPFPSFLPPPPPPPFKELNHNRSRYSGSLVSSSLQALDTISSAALQSSRHQEVDLPTTNNSEIINTDK